MPDRVSVTSADFVRNIGVWQEQALKTPVSITYHGRERLVLLAAELYPASPEVTVAPARTQAANIVLDHIAEGYVGLNDDLTISNVNRVTETYLGIDRNELIGRTPTTLFPALEGSMSLDQVRRVAATRTPVTFETDSHIFDGVRLSVTACPLVKGVGVLFANITELEALRAAATRADAVLTGIGQHRDVSVVKLDVRGRFISVDDKFAIWASFDPAALLNCRLVDLVAPADRRRVADCFDQAVTTRAPCALEAHMVTKDLRERSLSMSFAPIQCDDARMEVWTVLTSRQLSIVSKPAA